MSYTIVLKKATGHQTGVLVSSTGTTSAEVDIVFQNGMMYLTIQPTSEMVREKKTQTQSKGPAIIIPSHLRVWARELGRPKLVELGIPVHRADALLNAERMRESALLEIEALYESVKGEE